MSRKYKSAIADGVFSHSPRKIENPSSPIQSVANDLISQIAEAPISSSIGSNEIDNTRLSLDVQPSIFRMSTASVASQYETCEPILQNIRDVSATTLTKDTMHNVEVFLIQLREQAVNIEQILEFEIQPKVDAHADYVVSIAESCTSPSTDFKTVPRRTCCTKQSSKPANRFALPLRWDNSLPTFLFPNSDEKCKIDSPRRWYQSPTQTSAGDASAGDATSCFAGTDSSDRDNISASIKKILTLCDSSISLMRSSASSLLTQSHQPRELPVICSKKNEDVLVASAYERDKNQRLKELVLAVSRLERNKQQVFYMHI